MNRYSKVPVVLSIFFAIAIAEKKINLEDIERDNLRAESKTGTENLRTEESSYDVKAETANEKYRQAARQYQNDEEISGYVTPQQFQDKYSARTEAYQQDVKYLTNNIDYQQTARPIEYADYQQQVETSVPKGVSQPSSYVTSQQQLYYQPEVAVGNRYQTVQQKAATEKFAKNSNKETIYVNIPMAQLLSYYPNLAHEQAPISKSHAQPLLHRLAGQANQQIAIPIYVPPMTREPIYSNSKVTYEIQPQYTSYSSRYPQLTEAILPTRSPNKLIYAQGLLGHRQPQAQMHYLQEIVYAQQPAGALTYVPTIGSSHDAGVYERPSFNQPEGNKPSQNYASQTRNHHTPYDHQSPTSYALFPANYAPRLNNQIYQQQSVDNVQQDYENIPDSPSGEHDLPRLPAQNFKSPAATRLLSSTSNNENSQYNENHLIHSSEPRSLLESYVPSNLLAAQNSERYRERPIKLERGFLPSKINYVQSYKKRKTE